MVVVTHEIVIIDEKKTDKIPQRKTYKNDNKNNEELHEKNKGKRKKLWHLKRKKLKLWHLTTATFMPATMLHRPPYQPPHST